MSRYIVSTVLAIAAAFITAADLSGLGGQADSALVALMAGR